MDRGYLKLMMRLLVSAGMLGTGIAAQAADDAQTAITGTEDADVIGVAADQSAAASASSSDSGDTSSTATGVDAQAGDDEISGANAISTTADVDADLLTVTQSTKVGATATGIDAGDGDDKVDGTLGFSSTATASVAYGGAVSYTPPPSPIPQPDKMDTSVTAEATANGILTGAGADTATLDGQFDVSATSTAGGTGHQFATAPRDKMNVKTAATANATAVAINTDADADTVNNRGTLTNDATATSGALALALTTQAGKKVQIKSEASANSSASATGIDTAGDGTADSSEDTKPYQVDGLEVTYHKAVTSVTADDVVDNDGDITNTASATSGAGAAPVSIKVDGSIDAAAASNASATSTGITTGGGADRVTSGGVLTATSTSNAGAVSFGLEVGAPSSPAPTPAPGDPPSPATPSEDKDNKSSTNTNVTADARATGIDASGSGQAEILDRHAQIADGAITIDESKSSTADSDDDVVDNTGDLHASAHSTAGALSASITQSSGGSADSQSNSTATTYAAGILAGAGSDQVTNAGTLTVDATSDAAGLTIGVAIGKPADSSGTTPPADTASPKVASTNSTTVEARAAAVGIDAEGSATSSASQRRASLALDGVTLTWGESETGAAGDDAVTNDGIMTVTSTANAGAGSFGATLNSAGSASSDAGANAQATTTGIFTGAGNDSVTNNFALTATSTADAKALSIAIVATKPTTASADAGDTKPDKTSVAVKAGATAEASTLAIDTEGALHQKDHDNSVAINGNGLQLSRSRDDSSLAGNDTVVNHGAIVASSSADSGVLSVGLNVGAQGSVDAEATSKSTATTTAIHTGGGADSITSTEALTATADAHSVALTAAVSATKPGQGGGGENAITVHTVANAEASASATGIDAEGAAAGEGTTDTLAIDRAGLRARRATDTIETGGDDAVTNAGSLTASSSAFAGTAAVAVSVNSEGTTASDTNAVSRARAGGVLTGAGADSVDNGGTLTASATATSVGVSVSFAMRKEADTKATSNAKSTSDASAVGISTGAEAAHHVRDTQLTLAIDGLALTHSDQVTADTGTDVITNHGALDATATSTAGAIGASIAIDGSASSDVTASARSGASGIDAGGGADQVTNESQLDAQATSTSGALALAFGQAGTEKVKSETKVEASSTADATVTGIAADSGADSLIAGSLTIGADGLVGHVDYQQTAATGDDTIVNRGGINAMAESLSGAAGVSVAIDGAAKADVKSTANTRATAIDGGGGNDSVLNAAIVVADARSNSGALALGVSVGGKTSGASAARTSVDASSAANATSVGIAGDGAARNETATGDLTIDASGLDVRLAASSTVVSGDDSIDNRNSVSATSQANSLTAAVAVSIKGAANATANTTAAASAAALDAGGGADEVHNTGVLVADAESNAYTLNAAISTEGRAISNAGIMGAGTEARSRAVGIAGAGIAENTTLQAHEAIAFDDIGVTLSASTSTDGIGADGADTIVNGGAITATSNANAPRASIGITGKGVALSLGRVSAESAAAGIDGGNQDDSITNSADIGASSSSIALLANVAVTGKGLAVAANNVWDGGTEATSVANGIDGDGGQRVTQQLDAQADADLARVRYTKETTAAAGNDTIVNSGTVNVSASALAPSVNVAVAQNGVAAAVSTATAKAGANAIRGGDLADAIDNSGHLIAQTTATAAAANVALNQSGVAAAADSVWNGGTTAAARTRGIDGDGGERTHTRVISVGTDGISIDDDGVLADAADVIHNSGAIETTATSRALSVALSVTMNGVAAATATSNSTADAAAIDAGQGTAVDDVTNTGHLTATADALAASASITFANSGLAVASDSVWDGGTKANARARGIDVGAGGETIANSGAIDTTANATGASAAISAAVNGFAAAAATATGTADAAAIDAAAGDDEDDVTNSGALTATANSSVYTAALSFTNNGAAAALDAVWDGGTTATARARGIGMGNASDAVDNSGAISASGDARALALSASIAVNGVAAAVTSATALSDAAAIDLGDDTARDTVTNDAELISDSKALAATASISVTANGAALAADAPWAGGTSASASARGVRAGGGADDITNTRHVASHADADALAASIAIAVNGFAGAEAKSTASADSIALDAGTGDDVDRVTNSGLLESRAEANAASAAVSFTANGVSGSTGSVWDGGTYAQAVTSAVALGGGADAITNTGAVITHADAVSTGVSLAVSVQGVAGAITAAHSDAVATGIDAADGDDSLTNGGNMNVGAYSDANTISVAGTMFGVAAAANNFWDGGATSSARATALSAGAGADTIGNSGDLTTSSHSVSPSVAVGFSVAGVAAAVSTATSNADSRAIDGGDAADSITNSGRLTVDADSDAYAVNVSVTGAGVAVAADSVWDGGTTSNALANGIAGGAGNDTIRNQTANAVIQSHAAADTLSLSVAISGAGLAGATSTSTANANAAAIDAGTGDDAITNQAAVSGTADASATSVSVAVVGAGAAVATDAFWDGGTKANAISAGISAGDGNDTLTNTGAATATSTSNTLSAAISVSLSNTVAVSLASAASTSTADATALSAGAGDDTFANSSALTARATSTANGISVAFSPGGGAVAGGFDASTSARGSVSAIGGGDGNDTLRNLTGGNITLDSNAETHDLAVSLTLGGVAFANSNTLADARGTGLDGGAGNDALRNEGGMNGAINAHASSLGITAVGVGAAITATRSDSVASGAALAGGAGDDQLVNVGNVDLAFNADARGQAISIAIAGVQIADATAKSTIDAAGERGDAGSDTLVNASGLSTNATATTSARALSAAADGYTVANAAAIADATNTGLSGGADDDTLMNTANGNIRVRAASNVTADTLTVSLAGTNGGDARALSQLAATGLSGGDGNDAIGNDGTVTVIGAASTSAKSLTMNLAGTTGARAGIEVATAVTGIDGGAGRDTIVNTGTVNVGSDGAGSWMSFLNAESQTMQLGGTNSAQSAAYSSTRATGIAAGADDDTISHTGTINITGNAKSNTVGGSIGIFGNGSAGAQSGAFTSATGIDGGDGIDAIDSLGNVSVRSDALLTQDATAYQFGGSAASNAVLAALTEANGIVGGAGADRIANGAALRVDTTSTMTANSASSTTFGSGGDALVTSGGITHAFGIVGGDGNDIIDNRSGASLDLSALARVNARAVSSTFIGSGPSSSLKLIGDVTVAGLTGDTGNDSVLNHGAVSVLADSQLSSTGGSKATVTGTSDVESVGSAQVSSKATGLSGGDGDDLLGSYGTLDVHAIGTAESINDGSTGAISIVNDNFAGGTAIANATATGFDGGVGANRSEIAGDVSVHAESTAYALAMTSGATVSFASDTHSEAKSNAYANADGVSGLAAGDAVVSAATMSVLAEASTAKSLNFEFTSRRDRRSDDPNANLDPPPEVTGDDLPALTSYQVDDVVFWTKSPQQDQDDPARHGGYWQVQLAPAQGGGTAPKWVFIPSLFITDTRTIQVDSFPSYAAADGSGLAGDGKAIADGVAVATARGYALGDGNNSVISDGDVTVLARAEAVVHTSADGDSFGSAYGYTTATAIARATGIETGSGDDTISNSAILSVTATPIAQARAEASGGDVCIWFFGWWCGGGGTGYSVSTANFTASAVGIQAGEGTNHIVNDGTIVVRAAPDVHHDARTGEFAVAYAAADDPTLNLQYSSSAVGILTGSGNDTVENNGTLTVEATDVSTGCSTLTNCPGTIPANSTASAIGILTGAGDDVVTNNGHIDVRTTYAYNFFQLLGVAIDTGAGNDTLILGDGSTTLGTVQLADGDDTLILRGTPVTSGFNGNLLNVDAGPGTDTLVLDGAGAYAGTPLSIERATKISAGTYTLPSLATVQRLVVDQGTLRLASGYQFGSGATFSTFIDTDGTSGQLSAGGAADLAGSLAVEKRGADFVADGTRYSIVQADGGVSGAFSNVTLPPPMPLLQFELETTPNRVDVVANVPSFATVTRNPLYQKIAGNLDTIAGHTDEDFSQLLGRLQTMRHGFDEALASLSPESHLATQDDTFVNLHEMTRALRGHIAESRTRYRIAPFSSGPELSLQFSGGSSGIGYYSFNENPEAPAYAGGGGTGGPSGNRGGPATQFWMLALDASGKNQAEAGYTVSHTDTRGFLVGGDRRLGDNWMVGGQFGHVSTDVTTGLLATGRIQGSFGSLYGTWFDDTSHLEFGASRGGQTFRNLRTLTIGDETRMADSKHGGNAWSAFASGGINFGTEAWSVEPFISFDYFSADEDAFEETGAGALDQRVDARGSEALHGAFGANFAVRQQLRHSVLDWHASLAVDRDFGIDDSNISYSYAGAPQGTFTIDGRPTDDISRIYGLGVSLIGDQSAFTLDWRGLRNDLREEKFVSARISLRF